MTLSKIKKYKSCFSVFNIFNNFYYYILDSGTWDKVGKATLTVTQLNENKQNTGKPEINMLTKNDELSKKKSAEQSQHNNFRNQVIY